MDAVHADIHVLLQQMGGRLWGATRAEYEQLRDKWAASVRAEIGTAA
ncbi:hypothetical protein [Streptomyces sp. NPDC048419]